MPPTQQVLGSKRECNDDGGTCISHSLEFSHFVLHSCADQEQCSLILAHSILITPHWPLALFPGHLPLRFLDCMHDLWTAQLRAVQSLCKRSRKQSRRRPGNEANWPQDQWIVCWSIVLRRGLSDYITEVSEWPLALVSQSLFKAAI